MGRYENERKLALSYSERLRIWETNFGRDMGWLLEQHGETIALLTEPEWAEMFWVSYHITPLTQDPELLLQMQTKAFWNEMDGFVWRSRGFGVVVPHTFPSGSGPLDDRIAMYSLYIHIESPRPWDQVVLWWRKMKRSKF